MVSRTPDILYEDNHLLAINKPAGLATMGVPTGEASLLTWAREYVKRKYQKPGNVYLGVVSRLDALVTGVALFARTSKAAARLSRQFREREVRKEYWALIANPLQPSVGELTDWLEKSEAQRKMVICAPQSPGAVQARLRYRFLPRRSGGGWVEVELLTGRKHQIRVQLAARNCPILGDRKYGSPVPFAQGIALHARQLELTHPVRKNRLSIVAPLPRYWPSR